MLFFVSHKLFTGTVSREITAFLHDQLHISHLVEFLSNSPATKRPESDLLHGDRLANTASTYYPSTPPLPPPLAFLWQIWYGPTLPPTIPLQPEQAELATPR